MHPPLTLISTPTLLYNTKQSQLNTTTAPSNTLSKKLWRRPTIKNPITILILIIIFFFFSLRSFRSRFHFNQPMLLKLLLPEKYRKPTQNQAQSATLALVTRVSSRFLRLLHHLNVPLHHLRRVLLRLRHRRIPAPPAWRTRCRRRRCFRVSAILRTIICMRRCITRVGPGSMLLLGFWVLGLH
uniref:Transmembrane protein n=1 Tax=Opuntia streptacantha TaxID=393608 RepID=A0A7C9DKW5_OPUST